MTESDWTKLKKVFDEVMEHKSVLVNDGDPA